ncbi:MAG: hypothetical protein N2439_10295 [Anaerolineae bacterium]|nr:hypothetical protein [Anaerolineae bacterium]
MLEPRHLDSAVSRGIITDAQRTALIALASPSPERCAPETPDEQLRLVGGGNDIFVTIGILLFFAGGLFALDPFLGRQPSVLAALAAVCVLLLADIVTRQRRMRLASTVLALIFMVCAGTLVLFGISAEINIYKLLENPFSALALRGEAGWLSLAGTAAFVAAAALYFWRFRVPVLAAVIALSLTGLAFIQTGLFLYDGVVSGQVQVPLAEDVPDVMRKALWMPLICGLVVFGTAVALDLHDRERRTVWSDCAFWLHVVSAPMLVHPLFVMATGQSVAGAEIAAGADAVIALAVLIAGFTYIALAIDRRSLLVPTLGYFGTLGVQNLIGNTAIQAGIPPVALVLVSIGALVILFGAGWQRIRDIVVGKTLPAFLLKRLPPIHA